MTDANGVEWYAMAQHGAVPEFETGDEAMIYNQAAFREFMPGYEQQITSVDGSQRGDGHFEVRHEDGSGTMFYDTAQYDAPRGDYQVFEDRDGHQWFAVHGEPVVERKPVYDNGKPVYDERGVVSTNVESVRYRSTPSRFGDPKQRDDTQTKPPRRRS